MIQAKDYIKNELLDLKKRFPEITFKYEFNDSNQTHIIEVMPYEFFEQDLLFMEWEARFTSTFEDIYDRDFVLFISEKSLTQIKEAEFVIDETTFIQNKFANITRFSSLDRLTNTITDTHSEEYQFAIAA